MPLGSCGGSFPYAPNAVLSNTWKLDINGVICMRSWIRTLLFVSAFSPILLVLACVRYDIHGFQSDVFTLLVIGVLGICIPLLILKMVSKSTEVTSFEARKMKSIDFMLLAFIGSYLFPLVARASELSPFMTIILVLFIFLALWLINSIPPNPILRLFKYRFYEVESSVGVVYTLISKRDILDPKQIKMVKKISSSMLMEYRNDL